MRRFLARLRRKLPYLVWYDDEIDVCVTFLQDKLPVIECSAADLVEAMRPLSNGPFAQAQKILNDADITFDTGIGEDGRDWEWDFSLRGPISVRFRSRAERPELRRERPKPRLAVDSTRPAAWKRR